MKVEKINETREEIRLFIAADGEEMSRAYTDGLDAFLFQFNLGEAPGETAEEKITAALGEEEAQGAIYSAVINYLVPFALEEYGVLPLATYGIESEDSPVAGEPFMFQMTVLPKPEYELTSYDTLTIEMEPCLSVSESDIDDQIKMLVGQFTAEKEGADAAVPEVTDEWVAANLQPMGILTVEELRERFRSTSEEELQSRYEQAKMAAAMERYADRFDGDISKTMLSAMVQELYETFLAQLAGEGMTFEQFSASQGMSEEDVRDTLAQQAENQLIQGFILDAIFRHEGLKLETADLSLALRNMAPGHEDETFDAMEKSGRVFLLKEAASRMKAASWIMENTEFTTQK